THNFINPARVCGHMEQALASLADALEAPATIKTAATTEARLRLEVLPAAERQQVVREWNTTAMAVPRDRCVHELVEAQVARTPDAVAVVCGDAALTYAALDRRANQLAHALRAVGVGADARVAICVERSLELVIAVLGVLKAGGAYVPLDPAYPRERLHFMLQ